MKENLFFCILVLKCPIGGASETEFNCPPTHNRRTAISPVGATAYADFVCVDGLCDVDKCCVRAATLSFASLSKKNGKNFHFNCHCVCPGKTCDNVDGSDADYYCPADIGEVNKDDFVGKECPGGVCSIDTCCLRIGPALLHACVLGGSATEHLPTEWPDGRV